MKEKVICKQFYRLVSEMNEYNQFPHKFIILRIPNEHIPHAYYRGFTKSLVAQGMRLGAPDFVLTRKGGCGYIEFKSTEKAINKKTPHDLRQQAFAKECEELGIPYLITHDIDEAIEFVKGL